MDQPVGSEDAHDPVYSRDHSTDDRFYSYYAEESLSAAARQRFERIREIVLESLGPQQAGRRLDVADIGCGAGTQCLLWASHGHRVYGLDVNERLLDLARGRAAGQSGEVSFWLGTAEKLPWGDATMDVCILPELLEHVPDWQVCLDEAIRVLRPGGVLYLSTTNKLCPIQEEFNLPLYAWYPGFLKRRVEKLAVTTRPHLANYATYPAVHWFSFYSLRATIASRGFDCYDRFDTLDVGSSRLKKLVQNLITRLPPLRFVGHMLTPYTQVVAVKRV